MTHFLSQIQGIKPKIPHNHHKLIISFCTRNVKKVLIMASFKNCSTLKFMLALQQKWSKQGLSCGKPQYGFLMFCLKKKTYLANSTKVSGYTPLQSGGLLLQKEISHRIKYFGQRLSSAIETAQTLKKIFQIVTTDSIKDKPQIL